MADDHINLFPAKSETLVTFDRIARDSDKKARLPVRLQDATENLEPTLFLRRHDFNSLDNVNQMDWRAKSSEIND